MDQLLRHFHLSRCELGREPVSEISGIFIALRGGEGEPHLGEHIILQGFITRGVHHSQVVIGIRVPLHGRQVVPLHGFLEILRNSLAFGVHHPKVELGLGFPVPELFEGGFEVIDDFLGLRDQP